MNIKKSLLLVFVILLIDQAVKIYIKTHFALGEEVEVFSWFKIHFLENNGMAFGAELGGSIGKILLTSFRIIAIGGIYYWLLNSIKKKEHFLLIISISLILAGAIGNIIDSVFYGQFFGESSYHHIASVLPEQGYAPWFQGKVVDMFYFPLFEFNIAGKHFTFFEPIFNIADSAITVGVFIMIIFYKKIFNTEKDIKKKTFEQNIDEIINNKDNAIV